MTRAPAPRRRRPATEPPGLPARRAALRLLDAVLRRGQALEQALDGAVQGMARASDRALAHGIAASVLRRLPDLDALIDGATRQRLPDDAKARMVLRMALAQLLMLETPPHAALATALPLVDGGPRKLVHGVLGTLLRGGATLPERPTLPADVAARWRAAWGEAMVDAAADAIAQRPPLDLSLRDPATTGDWAARLGGVSLAPGHVRLPAGSEVTGLPGLAEGDWWVQDLAASLPARLLGPGQGRTALDLCAAPGGKTLQLAAAGWRVIALDLSERRLERLSDNLQRTGLPAEVIAADMLDWAPPAPVDAILLDAPCSATGIFRRHPDVIHRAGPRQIAEMADLQARMLDRAADWLKPGGRLLYATCSLEPQEGEAQVAAVLARRPDLRAAEPVTEALPEGVAPTAPGQLRTLPGLLAGAGGMDGFFMAHLSRSESP